MSEIAPPEDEIHSLFLQSFEDIMIVPTEEHEYFISLLYERTLSILDQWTEQLPERVKGLMQSNSASENTMKSYRTDLIVFFDWCLNQNKTPLPCTPINLIDFLLAEDEKGIALSTIKRRASSISWLHRKAGYFGTQNPRESAFFKESLTKLSRKNKNFRPQKAEELTTEIIREIILLTKKEKNVMKGLRDRALILIGFASAMRRENLVNVKFEDINQVIQGLEIHIPYGKTDQQGRGHVVRIANGQIPATCPTHALRDWIKASEIYSGFIFRKVSKGGKVGDTALTGASVSEIIKNYIKLLEIDQPEKYSAHSLRSGFASTAAQNGASIQSIKTQGNWRSDGSLMRYIRNKENWDVAASCKLGL